MASLDFETEKAAFRAYYDENIALLESAKGSFLTLIRSLLVAGQMGAATTTGRVKDREESIKKFNRKYRGTLESSGTPYGIADHITDLVGLRIVCLYEDEVGPVSDLIRAEFEVLGVTDKIAEVEGTENAFGYKGLHLDLKLDGHRSGMPEYALYASISFELQIRTIVQDSWSVLDHKIKYKQSIPAGLKRRINTLAALFELADREFRQVRDATSAEIEKAEAEDNAGDLAEVETEGAPDNEAPAIDDVQPGQFAPLNAFRFLRIAKHFFPEFEFEPEKVDGFTAEIVQREPNISRGKFNFYLNKNIGEVRRYRADFLHDNPNDGFNAYTEIRHALYAGNPDLFSDMLTNDARGSFDQWRAAEAAPAAGAEAAS